jgi:stearoyl-CoA desaturase (delta-9 desaturase)
MPINYTSVIFVLGYHIVAFYGLYNLQMTLNDFQCILFLYFFTGFGITAGYHRLWSHKSYNASYLLQIILAIAGAGASQGSILWWSRYHRLHHNKSDTDDDPYGPQKGFIYSHILWIFENRKLDKLKMVNVSDLKSNSIVMFQNKYYVFISLSCSIGMPLFYYLFNGYNIFNCICFPIAFSRVLVWHSTWFVNSLAHSFGTQDYGKSGTSRDNILTAFLTLGEGYHNFHHEFPYDYRNAIIWHQYDPTKWLIEMFYFLGLATNLKTNLELNRRIPYQSKMKDITLEEYTNLSKANNWLLYKGSVYNVTDLLDNHPGGEGFIKMVIGKSDEFTTEQFHKFNNHTQNAMLLMEKCKVCNITQI